jgi:hypothetical protein
VTAASRPTRLCQPIANLAPKSKPSMAAPPLSGGAVCFVFVSSQPHSSTHRGVSKMTTSSRKAARSQCRAHRINKQQFSSVFQRVQFRRRHSNAQSCCHRPCLSPAMCQTLPSFFLGQNLEACPHSPPRAVSLFQVFQLLTRTRVCLGACFPTE